MDDDKRGKAIERAKRAELLIKDPLIVECFAELEAGFIRGWKATDPRDNDARERLWQAVQIVGKVRDHLQAVLDNGKLSQRDLDDIAQPQKRGFFG